MCERFRKITYKTDKQLIIKDSLKDKSLKELILEKDEQHDTISIKFPIFISIAGIIISVVLTALSSLKPQILLGNNNIVTIFVIVLKYICGAAYILMFIRILIVIKNIVEEQNIISKNIKTYDEEIFERLDKHEKEKIALLEEIRDSIKS